MYFKNVDKIPLFDTFLEKYKERIDEILDKDDLVIVLSSKRPIACRFIAPNEYMVFCRGAITDNGSNYDVIVYDEANCNTLNLTGIERDAIIAHEIGHHYDTNTYKKNDDDCLRKEINADSMAYKLGLKDSLISGLRKLIDDQNPKEMKQIEQRIDFLLTQNDHQGTENEN